MADIELELAQFFFSSVIRGHHVYLPTHLRMRIATVHMNKSGYCSRAATITLSSCSVRRLFEGGVYSGCDVYSRKYGIYGDIPFNKCICKSQKQIRKGVCLLRSGMVCYREPPFVLNKIDRDHDRWSVVLVPLGWV